jgi:hypothetical protein
VRVFLSGHHLPMGLPRATSELPLTGPSDLAKVRADFLNKPQRLILGAPIVDHTEYSGKWHEAAPTEKFGGDCTCQGALPDAFVCSKNELVPLDCAAVP